VTKKAEPAGAKGDGHVTTLPYMPAGYQRGKGGNDRAGLGSFGGGRYVKIFNWVSRGGKRGPLPGAGSGGALSSRPLGTLE